MNKMNGADKQGVPKKGFRVQALLPQKFGC